MTSPNLDPTSQPSPKESQSKPTKLLVAASGTGGHLYPALAIADTLNAEGCEVEWLGVKNRLETKLVPSKYPLRIIPVEGFQNKDLRALLVLLKFFVSIWKTRQILKKGNFLLTSDDERLLPTPYNLNVNKKHFVISTSE